jgi:DNA-binding GntR family transcriptional regulator
MDDAGEKIERPKQVSELVLERLRTDIIENRFALGEKISEAQLSELYGVTKAPIRSAYIRLEGEGLIQIRPQSGTFVFKPTVSELRALCELRTALEVEACRLAMLRDPAGLERDFRALLDGMAEAIRARSSDRYQTLDTDLHRSIFRRADSALLAATYETQVNSRFVALRWRFSRKAEHNDHSFAEHIALRDAVIDRDAERLVRLLRKHIDYTEDYYSSLVN